MTTHKPFREVIRPNSNFEFVGTARRWIAISLLVIVASIVMMFVNKSWRGDYLNWSIDFKGGTEIILQFNQKGTTQPVAVEANQVRTALNADPNLSAFGEFTVSGLSWSQEDEATRKVTTVNGFKLGTREFGATTPKQRSDLAQAFVERFKDFGVVKVAWSGDRLYVRSKKAFDWQTAQSFFNEKKYDLRKWSAEDAAGFTAMQEGTGEYNAQFNLRGIDAQVEKSLEAAIPNADVDIIQTYGVGAAAGSRLRDDGIRSMFYAMLLIMVYLVVRFDIRFAPGAVIALLHDSFLVVGAFAFAWTEFSLTTVAAILTVIGYSVNDTVIIFDRIRENQERLKDKKLERVVNISLNETLSRTILTSSTLFAITLMMNILGTGVVRDFAFAMNVGIIVGTYSSIFIAAPIALWIDRRFYQGSTARRRVRAGSQAGSDPEPQEG